MVLEAYHFQQLFDPLLAIFGWVFYGIQCCCEVSSNCEFIQQSRLLKEDTAPLRDYEGWVPLSIDLNVELVEGMFVAGENVAERAGQCGFTSSRGSLQPHASPGN